MLTSDDENFGEKPDPLSLETDLGSPSINGENSSQVNTKDEFVDIFKPKSIINSHSYDEDNDDLYKYRRNMTEEVNIDLNSKYALTVDISDALSERDKVKYTVHTKTDMPEFAKKEISVVRKHEEFIWLHNCLETNEEYAGFIIPPAPPRPDFDASREKLQKLGEGESTMTKEDFSKMKQELEQEYLATFKKTVAMHEVFLCRLAAHSVFRQNANFRVFLEYDSDLSVRGKNKKEIVNSFFKRVTQSVDEVLLSGQKDVDEFFEHEKNHLIEYHSHIKEATMKADKVCRARKNTADYFAKIASNIEKIGQLETNGGDKEFGVFLRKISETLEKMKKAENRVGTDEELKEADTLRYFTRESQAGKELLYRRLRCLANYEASNRNLERARVRNRDIQKAESEQAETCKKFEEIGVIAKNELIDLKKRRVDALKKNLVELVELEVKQSKAKLSILQTALASLKDVPSGETNSSPNSSFLPAFDNDIKAHSTTAKNEANLSEEIDESSNVNFNILDSTLNDRSSTILSTTNIDGLSPDPLRGDIAESV